MNFAKKQSDNLEQQESLPPCSMESPLQRLLDLLRPRGAPTELHTMVVEEPEDLETDDEGLISFEEERVSQAGAEEGPWGAGGLARRPVGTAASPGQRPLPLLFPPAPPPRLSSPSTRTPSAENGGDMALGCAAPPPPLPAWRLPSSASLPSE